MIRFFKIRIDRLFEDRLYLFRFLCLLICLDIIAFLSLSSISYWNLLNPFYFLEQPGIDERRELRLYYPVQSWVSNHYGKKLNRHQKKNRLRSHLMPVSQKVFQISPEGIQNVSEDDILKKNVSYIVASLSSEPKTLQARSVLRNVTFIRYLWIYQKSLIIHLAVEKWKQLEPETRKLIKVSLEKSVLDNLKGIHTINWVTG